MFLKRLLLLLLVWQCANLAAQGFLHRSGQNIVNNSGIFFPKGTNLGNWLVEEGYMMGSGSSTISGANDWRNAVVNLVGSTNAQTFFTAFRANYITSNDINALASAGYNHVRLPLDANDFLDTTTNTLKNDGFVYIDNLVTWCAANNMYIILDLHKPSGSQLDGGDLWTYYAVNKKRTARVWRHIADRYKNNTTIGGYDLLNEPIIAQQAQQWKLKDLYISCTDSIRSVDTNHLLFAEGNWYASSLWELLANGGNPNASDRWDENMAYSIHNYWTDIPSPGIGSQEWIKQNVNIPMWLGETGENSNHWIGRQIADLTSRNVGWCFWSYKKVGSISALSKVNIHSGFQTLLDYWNGSVAQPTATFAFNALMEFATDCNFTYCSTNRDVIDATLRTDFLTVSKPFQTFNLPCTIQAVDYDMGGNGVASNDVAYQSLGQGANYTTYNNGWRYRNDGVDVDNINNAGIYAVGWIDAGEWLTYTVNVPITGIYDVVVKVASGGTSGSFQLELDNIAVTNEVNVPNTGGWWSLRNLTALPITFVSTGIHKLKFKALRSGFNVKEFALTFKSAVLPINLLYFNAQVQDKTSALLTWASDYEDNFDSYQIERRGNGGAFLPIDTKKVVPKNKVQKTDYQYLDKDLSRGVYDYRLKNIDTDGHFSYSKIVSVSITDVSKWAVYPNPTTGMLFVETPQYGQPLNTTFRLLNSIGQIVLQGNERPKMIDLQGLSNGVYWLKIGEQMTKIIKE